MERLRDARFLPAGWLVFLAAFGGASRYDEWQQLAMPIGAVFVLAIAFWTPDRETLRSRRILWIFLLAIAGIVAMQLVPLPAVIWTNLPGRKAFVLGATLAGLDANWRPLSLTPDLTWASLFSLLPVAATLAIAPDGSSRALRPLIWTAIVLFLIATLLGVIQSLGGGAFRLYRIANVDSAVGLFANRNHHAVFLALAFPMIAYLVELYRSQPATRPTIAAIGGAVAALCIVSIIQAQSRSGLILGTVMLGCVLTAIATGHLSGEPPSRRRFGGLAISRPKWWTLMLVAVAAIMLIGLAIIVSHSVALDRLMKSDVTYDYRVRTFSTLVDMAVAFAPFGSGFGSFSTVYRLVEPYDSLRYTYLNQAHNDLAQIVIEGGLPGLVLMVAAAAMWGRRAVSIIRAPRTNDRAIGVVGTVMVGVLMLASAVDYPLRTPLMAGMLVFGAAFMVRRNLDEPSLPTP